jgi:hypothetical protein
VKAKNVNRKGQATFNLSKERGLKLTYLVDPGRVLGGLFWDQSRVPFKV